jgi:hypothetical protein
MREKSKSDKTVTIMAGKLQIFNVRYGSKADLCGLAWKLQNFVKLPSI